MRNSSAFYPIRFPCTILVLPCNNFYTTTLSGTGRYPAVCSGLTTMACIEPNPFWFAIEITVKTANFPLASPRSPIHPQRSRGLPPSVHHRNSRALAGPVLHRPAEKKRSSVHAGSVAFLSLSPVHNTSARNNVGMPEKVQCTERNNRISLGV